MKRQFGRYVIADEVADELGRGSFGRVYRAFDPNVNRYVAVKVLSSGSDPDMLSRFQDESKTAGKLEHENIVKVYDFDLQDGMPYLVMELLEGVTLESMIKTRMFFGHPIQLLDEVEIMFQVAAGLQFAHAQNVIHRDIKPGNIMVLPNGTAKVMDFGIARMMDKGGTRRTRQGDIAGTILYMAPEQFKGCDADKRTDIFSYADVFYELLTGEHPFFASDPGTVMYRISAHDPPPIRERLPECPAALESMIQRLMAKDREIRPDKLEEVIFDTQPILQGLRQERAAALVAGIPALIGSGDQKSARQAIRQVLELDPLNSVARRLRDELLDEDRRKAIRARVQALSQEAEDHVASRRFGEAVQCFERAYGLDKSDGSLRSRLDEVKLVAENARKATRWLGEARAELQQGRLETALEKCERAAECDSANQEAVQLVYEVRKRIKERCDRNSLVRAKEHRDRGEYEAALAVLDRIEDGSAAKVEAVLLRGMVERDRVEAEIRRRRQLFQAALSEARELLIAHRLDEALVSAEALDTKYPEEPEAADFLSEVREHLAARGRLEAVGRITLAARSLVKEDRLSDARNVIEEGLHSYPGDTNLVRLLQVAAALAAAQERAARIGHIVEQTHSLAAERRIDEAMLMIDRAIAEYGNEFSLAERKRDLELERARAEYAASLEKTLSDARSLLKSERSGEAAELLEEAKFRFPGESELAVLLSEARAARAAEEEREFVLQTLSEVAALEACDQFGSAMSKIEAALAQYPSNADLPPAVERLSQKLREQARQRMLASRIGRIEAAIQAGDWERAEVESHDAESVFPVEEALARFPDIIAEGRRNAELELLRGRVEASLSRMDLEVAESQLAAAGEAMSHEPIWQDLQRGCQRLRRYCANLASAESARSGKDYALAEEILRSSIADALDQRASKLLGEVLAERRAVEEAARREEEQRRRREAEEARRERERAAIARGRAEAVSHSGKAEYRAAIVLLERLAGQYPSCTEIRQDLESARREWERQQREAEEQALRRREEALAAGRGEAAELLRNGDAPAAIELLAKLESEFPDDIELRQKREALARELEEARLRGEAEAIAARRSEADELLQNGDSASAIACLDRLALEFPNDVEIRGHRETIVRNLERQRLDTEERGRRQREDAIAARRAEAAELLRSGNASGAIALLDRLALEFPDCADIRRDRKTAVREEKRQRREAEEHARQESERAAVAEGRAQASALSSRGSHREAAALLDQLAAQYPGNQDVRKDREAARSESERRQREVEEQARRRREEAIASGRQAAAELLAGDNIQGAIAILDRLSVEYPEVVEIRRDRAAALSDLQRRRQQAEERARQERERAAIAEGRDRAATLVREGSHQTAVALLDQLARQYPGDPEIRKDREAAWREWDRQQREAEEQARRERELSEIAQGRVEASALMKNDDYKAALALLDRMALQFPDDPGIAQDRKLASQELERQHFEAEARARRALASFSGRSQPVDPGRTIPYSRTASGKQFKRRSPGPARRSDAATVSLTARRQPEPGIGGDAGIPAASGARSPSGETAGHRTSGASHRSSAEGQPVVGPTREWKLTRLFAVAGSAIVTVRNAIAGFLGRGD